MALDPQYIMHNLSSLECNISTGYPVSKSENKKMCAKSANKMHYSLQLECDIHPLYYMMKGEYKAISAGSASTMHSMTRPEYEETGLPRFNYQLIPGDEECNGSCGVHWPWDENSENMLAEIPNKAGKLLIIKMSGDQELL